MRALVWLAAPLAAELASHKDFRASDPRQAFAFLKVAQEKYGISYDDEDDLLEWAAREASNILNANAMAFSKLAAYFKSKSATAGDCVALLEAAEKGASSSYGNNEQQPQQSSSFFGLLGASQDNKEQ